MVAAPALSHDDDELEALARDTARVMFDLRAFGRMLTVKNQHHRPRSGTKPKVHFGWSNWNEEQRCFERDRTGYDLILKSRQIGASTLEKARDLQFALVNEASHVLIVTHNDKTKRLFFNTLRAWANDLAKIGIAPPLGADTVDLLHWPETGSSIQIVEAGATEATADSRGRSGTIDRLHATEVAFWRSAEATWASLSGATEHGSEIVIESTANGQGSLFHQQVVELQQGRFKPYRFHFYPWFQHGGREADPSVYNQPPRTRRERLWEERMRALGVTDRQLAWWRMKLMAQNHNLDFCLQEWPPTPEAAFQSGGDTWIEPEHIERVQAAKRDPKRFAALEIRGTKLAPLRVYEEPDKDAHYVIGCDPSEGGGGDEAAIIVMNHRTGETVAAWDSNEVKPAMLGHVVCEIGRLYNTALLGIERNAWRTDNRATTTGGGLATIKVALEDERYPRHRVYHAEDGKAGWHTGSMTKGPLMDDLAHAVEEEGGLVTPDAKTAKELASVEIDPKSGRPRVPRKGKRRRGDESRNDDGLLIAWAIAWQVKNRTRTPGPVIAMPAGDELESVNFQT